MQSEASNNDIRIVIICRGQLFRAGLHLLIEEQDGMQIVGVEGEPQNGLETVARTKPNVVLLDIDSEQDGTFELMSQIRATGNGSRVIVLSEKKDLESSMSAIRAGAKGHVFKGADPMSLFKAINKVHAGEVWFDRSVMADVIDQISGPGQNSGDSASGNLHELLTERELDVVRLVCEGLRNKQIAARLHISESTVRHHLTSTFYKLELSDRFQLVLYAFRNGIVEP
jgi:DNA-binding NarL/FixJ family response regulator